jgi:hypothetical protein
MTAVVLYSSILASAIMALLVWNSKAVAGSPSYARACFAWGATPNATMARPTSSSRPSMERARTPAATRRRRSDVPPVPRRRHGTTGTTVYGYLLPESSSSFISCSMRAAESQSPLSRACRSCARRA